MPTKTKAILGIGDETLEQLRELRRLNVDSAKGFEECIDLVEDDELKVVFTKIAHTRREQAQVLANQIDWNDELEEEDGSYLAGLHRAWIKVREACTSESAESILQEIDRGEKVIAEAYDDALSQVVGTPIRELILQQRETLRQAQEELERLHNAQ